MKVSIVIPVYNSADTLDKLLESIESSEACEYEIIIVDDCSTDNSVQVANSHRAKVIRLEQNQGPAAARNRGVELAEADVVLFLDADVVIPPHLIAHVARRFENEPELLGLNGYYQPEPLNPGFFPHYKARYINYMFQGVKETEALETACAAVRRQVLLDLGGFDTTYHGADVEDYELGYRIAQLGPMEVDHKMVVGHHFPGFIGNARNFFRRSAMWTELFLKRRKFDAAATTGDEGLVRILGATCVLFALLILLGFDHLFLTSVIIFCIYSWLNRGFIKYLYRNSGLDFLLIALGIHLANSVVISAGAAYGTLTYLYKRLRGDS